MSACKELIELKYSNSYDSLKQKLTPCHLWDEQYRFEKERLKTFENWPLEWLDKNILAKTGMFYFGEGDKTRCYFCEIIIGKWEQQDDPVQEHLRWSPNCPLLKRCKTKNVPLNVKALDALLPPGKPLTYDTPPTLKWKTKPINDYSIKTERLNTFADWPRSLKQKPEQLAEAGFFYRGTGDAVICFSCLGGLKDWEDDDDPWEQHALWMGHYCPYVKHVKGEKFIQNVVNKFKNSPPKKLEENFEEQEHQNRSTEEQQLDDYKLCKICYDKECNTVYIPCGHVVACPECAFDAKECPLCRAPVERVVRLYFS